MINLFSFLPQLETVTIEEQQQQQQQRRPPLPPPPPYMVSFVRTPSPPPLPVRQVKIRPRPSSCFDLHEESTGLNGNIFMFSLQVST